MQIRLMIAVVILLGALSVSERFFTSRFPFHETDGASGVFLNKPVETRLEKAPPATSESLTTISMPALSQPWTQSNSQQEANESATDSLKSTIADFWRRLYESLSVKQRDRLQATLRYAICGEAVPLGTSDSAELMRDLKTHSEQYEVNSSKDIAASKVLSKERQDDFKSAIEKTMLKWRQEYAPAISTVLLSQPISAKEKETLIAIESIWRGLALSDVRDDEVASSKDFVAWFGLFDQLKHGAIAFESAQEANYAELFNDSTEFRGKPLLVKGTIRAAEYQKAQPNLYSIDGYYVFWIRPDNYQDAPIKVFSLYAPGDESAAKGEINLAAFIDRPCELKGLFFKRTAYRAQDEIRAVPTVLCSKLTMFAPDTSIKDANESFSLVMLAVLVGVIGAVLFLVYFFTDRTRIKRLPDQLDLPTNSSSVS